MGRAALLFASVLSVASFTPAPANAQSAVDARALEPDVAVERDLAPGQTHVYLLTLTPGQYAHVVIDQRGIDVMTALAAPGGQPISTFDSERGRPGVDLGRRRRGG